MIIRGPRKRRGFTVVDNDVLRDARLSFRARGVLGFLLSWPPDHRISSEEIATFGREGRDAVRTALRELEAAGYLERHRRQLANGQWVTDAIVHESPTTGSQASENQPPAPGSQSSGDQALSTEGLVSKDSPLPPADTAPLTADESGGGGTLIDQALERWGRVVLREKRARGEHIISDSAFLTWHAQQNRAEAERRGAELLARHDLNASQLGDALAGATSILRYTRRTA